MWDNFRCSAKEQLGGSYWGWVRNEMVFVGNKYKYNKKYYVPACPLRTTSNCLRILNWTLIECIELLIEDILNTWIWLVVDHCLFPKYWITCLTSIATGVNGVHLTQTCFDLYRYTYVYREWDFGSSPWGFLGRALF